VRRRLAFVLWTVVASAVLLEILLRVGALFVAPPTPIAAVADPDAFRVLAVGDSWIAGAEAPPGQGFVDVLAEELPAALGRPVQVVNLGRNGANSAHAATAALDAAPALSPDVVVVLVGLNNGSNLQGVAELDQRLGAASSASPIQLRTVQALRIAAVNLGLGAPELPVIPPMLLEDDGGCVHGDFAFGSLADASGADLCRGTPRVQAPLLASEAGVGYLERFVDHDPPPSSDALDDLAFAVLYAAARGDAPAHDALAASLAATVGDAPVRTDADVRARYALLRHAREMEDWKAVRRHGGALDAHRGRGLLRDLGAAEARILAGDWRTARALLISAHHRAPGFPDVVDLASRFPEPARDGRVHDAIEWPWPGRTLPRDSDRRNARPGLYHSEAHTDPVEAAFASAAPGPSPPTDAEASAWATHLAGHAGAGGRDRVVPAVRRFLQSSSADHAAALGQAVRALRVAGDCDLLLETADRWYVARGDAHGWVRAVDSCLDRDAAAARLDALREAWDPLGDSSDWDALIGADHRSFPLLHRHLAAIAEAAPGARIVVLSYPNHRGAFGMHRDAVADYAAQGDVEFVDMYALFEQRYDDAQWDALLAPGGHCNAAGYRVMGEELARRLAAGAR